MRKLILSLCLIMVLCNLTSAAQAPTEYVFTGNIAYASQNTNPLCVGADCDNTVFYFSSSVFTEYEQYAGYYITILYNGEYRTYYAPHGSQGSTNIGIDGLLNSSYGSGVQYANGSTIWIHQSIGNAGTGTLSNPHQISNVYQLQLMKNQLLHNYVLINNIDASVTSAWNGGAGFEPIGRTFTPFVPFRGTFDGNGYVISDLYINRDESYPSLFGYTYSATIENLGIENATVIGTHAAGTLAARAENTKIRNVSATGNVTGYNSVGGLVGGIVNNLDHIENCYANVNVYSTYSTGGLVGDALNGARVSYSYSIGHVNASHVPTSGGLIGNTKNPQVVSSYYNYETSGKNDTGKGTPKTTLEMQTQSTFAGWDFYDTWKMSGYPILYYQVSDDFYLYPGNQTISVLAPPLLHSITLDMFKKEAYSYDITIATDDLYTNVVYSANKLSTGGVSNLTQTVSLEARTYYMIVRAKDISGNTIDTATSTFTISQTIDLGSTSVAGNIYEIISGVNTPISNVKVTLYNDTVSYDYITSSNGYYQFTGLANSTTYNMVAVKNGYVDSTLNVFTSVNGSTVTKNILMQKEQAPNYIMPHYVRFTVRSMLGGVYEGVLVTVYEGNSATPLFTQTTGSDGAVGFELSENIRYRLTLYSESYNINTVYRVTPTKNEYNIYVSLTGSSHQDDEGLILYGMHIDGNQLNVTWQDTSGLTSLVEVTVRNRDGNTAYYLNSTLSEGHLTQAVNTTENLTYIVELKIQTAGLDETFIRTHILTFESGVRPAFDLGFSAPWQSAFLAALSLIFLAVIFGSGNAHVGAILVSLGGLFHIFVTGWIPASVLTVAMAFIAVIVSVVFYMRKGEDVR